MLKHITVHESPGDFHGYCGGRDATETECTCPDLVWTTRTRLKTPNSCVTALSCYCCHLPIDRDHPPFGRSTA